MKISVDVDELLGVQKACGVNRVYVHLSLADYDKVAKHFGIRGCNDSYCLVNDVVFSPEPSITEELDRLLAQRVQPSSRDQFVMTREVWVRLQSEGVNNQYRGADIYVQKEVEGGVQLKCDYYIKGNL